MSKPTNLKAVGGYSGCIGFGWLAQNLTTGNIAYFYTKIGSPDKGLTYNVDFLKSPIKETGSYKVCDGDVDGLIKGESNFETKELSLTYIDSYNQKFSEDPTIAKNLQVNVLQGGVFTYDGAKWAVIGTNGTRNIGTKNTDEDHKYYFLEEGKVVTPNLITLDGERATEENGFVTAYDDNNAIAVEVLYNHPTAGKSGHRMVYVIGDGNEFNEGSGTDPNKYSSTMMRCSDVTNIDKRIINGLTNTETLQTSGTDALYRVTADIVIEVSGGGIPTVAGTVGQQAVVIDSDDNTVELYLHDGTDWGTTAPAVTSTLGAGAVIYSRSTDTALDGATATDRNILVAVKTAGATGVAVAVDTKVWASGTGSSTCILDMYDWSYSLGDFVQAVGDIV